MAEHQICFDDGAAYERMMGKWSRLAGDVFLDWLAPSPDLRWLDVGCGNGAFTELIAERCAPARLVGIDPSEPQLSFARARHTSGVAEFHNGNAMKLPYPSGTFDAAVMALVIFFVPDPALGVAEMVRVASPGGTVAAYAWDLLGGGFPLEPIQAELRALGKNPLLPPSPGASRIEALRDLWTDAGVETVETREITVQRSFADFDDFWTTSLGSSVRQTIAEMAYDEVESFKRHIQSRLPTDVEGHITYEARANAIKGRVPRK